MTDSYFAAGIECQSVILCFRCHFKGIFCQFYFHWRLLHRPRFPSLICRLLLLVHLNHNFNRPSTSSFPPILDYSFCPLWNPSLRCSQVSIRGIKGSPLKRYIISIHLCIHGLTSFSWISTSRALFNNLSSLDKKKPGLNGPISIIVREQKAWCQQSWNPEILHFITTLYVLQRWNWKYTSDRIYHTHFPQYRL